MAASLKVGGYQCKFIDEVPDDLLCKSCRHVARKPHLTSCCGNHFCHTCISQVQQDKKPCPEPTCQEPQFTVLLNKGLQKKILALHVHCMMKDRGCQWMGKVEHLDAHLNVNSGDCECVDVECPQKCGQQVQKHQLANHIANDCPKRDFTCMYCGFKATYEVVSEKHWPECQNYPVPCPNRCQIGAVERNTLEDHLNMCNLRVVECDFSYAGCNEKLQRQDMEKHVEENTQKHLALVAAANMKMKQEFDKQLQEQRNEFRGYLEQKDEQIKVVEERLQQLVREKEEQMEVMRKSLQKERKEGEQQLVKQDQEKQQQIEALRAQVEQVQQVHEKQTKAVEERLQQSVREKEEQIENMRKLFQKEQKGEQQLQQQLEQERQIKHIHEGLQEIKRELHEKKQQIEAQQIKQDHEEQIKAAEQQREEQIKSLQVQSQQQVERIEMLEKQLELNWAFRIKLGVPPLHLTMYNFKQHKYGMTRWYSPSMYTHNYGYKFHVEVNLNWNSAISWLWKEVYVSVSFLSDRGEFDDTLQWPAKFTITLQLLNQYRDRNHIRVEKMFQWERGYDSQYFTEKLIAHTDLELNTQKQTQYLMDDCLRFCITKIEARK